MQKKKSWVLISPEHDLASSICRFPSISATTMGGVTTETIDVTDLRRQKLAQSSAVQKKQVDVIQNLQLCVKDRFAILKDAMSQIGVTGMTVSM